MADKKLKLFPDLIPLPHQPVGNKSRPTNKSNGYERLNLGKAIRLPVPDFNNPDRAPVSLEVDFPVTPVNALSNLEGNAGKPIYQMSKWWARRRSSVFRSILIAAAVEAPKDPTQAAKLVWDHYYCNHQKAGTFKKLRVLDIFMGGGTTLVEGARLGMQMVGVDLNPVAWFVTKNELACSDPDQVKALFGHIESEVKPLTHPLYTTTCLRGHKGRWLDVETNAPVTIDPLELSPNHRKRYRWEGPEVVYTFWAKHGPCQAKSCYHRTPVFRSPIIAEKKLSTAYISTNCPSCGHAFDVELGATRMAPGAERVVLDTEPSFVETTQRFAQLLKDYDKGTRQEKYQRIARLLAMVDHEPGLRCPKCSGFANDRIKAILQRHDRARRLGDLSKKDFRIEKRPVFMYLLVHPNWLEGAAGFDGGKELGGYAGAPPESTVAWYEKRLEGLRLVEVRGRIRLADDEAVASEKEEIRPMAGTAEEPEEADEDVSDRRKYGLPRQIRLKDGSHIQTRNGTVPEQSEFTCGECGRQQDLLEAVRLTGHTPPVAAYALQCHCPQCQEEGYGYGGRYFKAPDNFDIERLALAGREWFERSESDLIEYWPRAELWPAYMTHKLNGGIPNWGYTHWWKMFNPRQLLIHAQLLRAITNAPDDRWSLDVREQALGAFQQYLRNQNMFCFWNLQADKMEPMFSNNNYHPKANTIENNAFGALGRGNWISAQQTIVDGMEWAKSPQDLYVADDDGRTRTAWVEIGDAFAPNCATLACCSSTDLSLLRERDFDLVITDPPFGDNLFYADLADFFFVWIRIPFVRWHDGIPEQEYFKPERTPHAMEAVDNSVEHPDDREEWEKERLVKAEFLEKVRALTGNFELTQNCQNPLYRPDPASEFYQRTLAACWAEAGRLLKPGGLMAFTFHHSADAPWVDVLEALFSAGYILVATYPIRSDESKGETGAFGSRKIEYDIVHVCRKRLEEPLAVSWSRMRRWVKEEATRLKGLLEYSHGKTLPNSDLLVILRGKALEFYSRHYGQVYTGDAQLLGVREALLGINQLLEDLLEGEVGTDESRVPDSAEPVTRLFLRVFHGRRSISRDELHKTLRGTGVAQADFETRGWIRAVGTTVHVVPIAERFQYFIAPGRNRRVLKTDLDQVHFLIGAAQPGSGIGVTDELNRRSFSVKRSVDVLLDWFARNDSDDGIREAARLAYSFLEHWRVRPAEVVQVGQVTFFDELEAENT
jgi:adenine-specific DNA methylase